MPGINKQLPFLQLCYANSNNTVTIPSDYNEGVKPFTTILSNDSNAIWQYTTEVIVEMQQSGTLFYNSSVIYPQGAFCSYLIGNVVSFYQALQSVPLSTPPTNSTYWKAMPMANSLNLTGGTMTGSLVLSNKINSAVGGIAYFSSTLATPNIFIQNTANNENLVGITYNFNDFYAGIFETLLNVPVVLRANRTACFSVYPDGNSYVNTGSSPNTTLSNKVVTKGYMDTFLPIGAIILWAGSVAPANWAICNGQNGTPDLRGVFVRGVDSGRGLDPSRALGSYQADSLQDCFTGQFFMAILDSNYVPFAGSGSLQPANPTVPSKIAVIANNIPNPNNYAVSQAINFNPAYNGGRLAPETRAKNVALNYIMRIS